MSEIDAIEEPKGNTSEVLDPSEVVETKDEIHSKQENGSSLSKMGAGGEKENAKPLDPSKVEYVGDKCYYTDETSGTKFEWNETSKEWSPATDISRNYEIKDGVYHYTDENTGTNYKWNADKNSWDVLANSGDQEGDDDSEEFDDEDDSGEPRAKKKKSVVRQDMTEGVYGIDGDKRTYTDPKDGTVYVWDDEKNAWFPKVDDDFLAQYQMSYGFTEAAQPKGDPEPQEEPPKLPVMNEEPVKKKPSEPAWFDVDEKSNTKVYVSNLPLDITEQEFLDLMQKCGLVMKDVETGKMKLKLYSEPGGKQLKGDGLCTYIKVESVQLALNLLDGYDFKGKKIKVERAKFTMKGSAYDPSLKPRKRKKKAIEKIKKMQEKLFDWRPDKLRGERERHERVVILKNVFDPSIFDKDPGLILEYQQDLREECIKCGEVKKVTVIDAVMNLSTNNTPRQGADRGFSVGYSHGELTRDQLLTERHPEGVAQIVFKEAEAADACVQLLNGRWFGQRKIEASTWDGKTKYRIQETEEEIEARIRKWESYLEAEESKKEKLSSGGKSDAKEGKDEADSDGTRSSAGSGDETE